MNDIREWALGILRKELHRSAAIFPTWPTDPLHALAILSEELGELSKEAMERTYQSEKGPLALAASRDAMRTEAFQLAASAIRFAISIPLYRFAASEQHTQ